MRESGLPRAIQEDMILFPNSSVVCRPAELDLARLEELQNLLSASTHRHINRAQLTAISSLNLNRSEQREQRFLPPFAPSAPVKSSLFVFIGWLREESTG